MRAAVRAAMAEIQGVVEGSQVPEDPIHARETLRLLLIMRPQADLALQVAALGHDLERALPPGLRVERSRFPDYASFKAAHARNSAGHLTMLLRKHHLPEGFCQRVRRLVERHEVGGDPDSDLLKEADSLSFFTTNLPHYLEREGEAEALRRCRWGWERLGPRGRAMLRELARERSWLAPFLEACQGPI